MPAPKATPAKVYEVKMSHFMAPTHHLQRNVFEPWAKLMEEKSNGAFKVTIYPSQALGRSADHYDMAVNRVAEVTFVVPSYTAGRFPKFSVVELPFLHPTATMGGEIATALFPKYLKDEFKEVKVLWLSTTSVYHVFTVKKPVRTLDDFKGMKLRNPGGVMTDVLEMLGATPVSIAAGDIYTSVERGVVDGVVLSYASIQDYGLDKLIKYGTELGLGSPGLLGAMNLDFYNGLPADLKKVVDDISLQMGGAGENWPGRSYDTEDQNAAKWFKQIGMEFITLSPEEMNKLRASVSGIYEKWLSDVAAKGLPGRQLLDDYVAELAKRGVTVTLPILKPTPTPTMAAKSGPTPPLLRPPWASDFEMHKAGGWLYGVAVTLRWDSVPSALRYRLYMSAKRGGPYQLVQDTADLSYKVTGLWDPKAWNPRPYYFVVTAVYEVGESGYSYEHEVTPPFVPEGLYIEPR